MKYIISSIYQNFSKKNLVIIFDQYLYKSYIKLFVEFKKITLVKKLIKILNIKLFIKKILE